MLERLTSTVNDARNPDPARPIAQLQSVSGASSPASNAEERQFNANACASVENENRQ